MPPPRPTSFFLFLFLQTRVQDGSRVRGLPQVDPVSKVAFAPHCNILAFSVDDARSPRVEHHCVRLLVPAHA